MAGALERTGVYLLQHGLQKKSEDPSLQDLNERFYQHFEETIVTAHIYNPWFTEANVRMALTEIGRMLTQESIAQWVGEYKGLPANPEKQRTVGVIMAGNIPLVGFHDMLCVIASGHRFLGKPSSRDDKLIRLVADLICSIEPAFTSVLSFTDEYLNSADAIIATGSDNSSRYFDYYFRDKPHIIRKNRNGVAVLTGNETRDEIGLLGKDIFSYFGLGCRNVTKIYMPENFKPETLLEVFESFTWLAEHHKYMNNIQYNRSVYLMNTLPFLDNGIVLFREMSDIASPVGVVYYEKYSQLDEVIQTLETRQTEIQCIISIDKYIKGCITPGNSQSPALRDYADGIDTLQFLSEITETNGI